MKSKPEIAEGAETRARAPVFESADNELTDRIIGAAIEVHRHLGPGLLESVYEVCLCYELSQAGLRIERQVQLPVCYKGIKFESGYKLDLVVEDSVIIEIKAIEQMAPIHAAQLLTYLKSSNKRIGLLINFNVPVLKNGLKRIVNHYSSPATAGRISAPSATERPHADVGGGRLESISNLPSPRLRVSASRTTVTLQKEPA